MGEAALRASVAVSPITACLLIAAGLAASWALTSAIGGANTVVPHWFYVPILFAAVRSWRSLRGSSRAR